MGKKKKKQEHPFGCNALDYEDSNGLTVYVLGERFGSSAGWNHMTISGHMAASHLIGSNA